VDKVQVWDIGKWGNASFNCAKINISNMNTLSPKRRG
jgi:predicted carbohydrate-binding protein with CBM5 and CBM33 domain